MRNGGKYEGVAAPNENVSKSLGFEMSSGSMYEAPTKSPRNCCGTTSLRVSL